MRRLFVLFISLVVLSVLYFPAFCQAILPPAVPPTPPVQILFIFKEKDVHTVALQAALSHVPAAWLTLRPGSPATGVWKVCVASNDAEWEKWRSYYGFPPDEPEGWQLCGETVYERDTIFIRNTDNIQGIFAHECFHALIRDHFSAAEKDILKSRWHKQMKQGKMASNYARTNWEEGSAEAFRCCLSTDSRALQNVEDIYKLDPKKL